MAGAGDSLVKQYPPATHQFLEVPLSVIDEGDRYPLWPDLHHALPGRPSEKGPERRGTIPRAPLHSQRPIASKASNALTARAVPAGTFICRRKWPGFPFAYYPQVLWRPALRPWPDPLHMMSGCTIGHFFFQYGHLIYRRKPAALLVCERLKRAQAVSVSLSFINASIRSAMRCAGSRSCPMVHSAAYPSVMSLDQACMTSHLGKLRGTISSRSAIVMKQLRMPV